MTTIFKWTRAVCTVIPHDSTVHDSALTLERMKAFPPETSGRTCPLFFFLYQWSHVRCLWGKTKENKQKQKQNKKEKNITAGWDRKQMSDPPGSWVCKQHKGKNEKRERLWTLPSRTPTWPLNCSTWVMWGIAFRLLKGWGRCRASFLKEHYCFLYLILWGVFFFFFWFSFLGREDTISLVIWYFCVLFIVQSIHLIEKCQISEITKPEYAKYIKN